MTLLSGIFLFLILLRLCYNEKLLNLSIDTNCELDEVTIGDKVFSDTSLNSGTSSSSKKAYILSSNSTMHGQKITISCFTKYYQTFWINAMIKFDKESWNTSSFWLWSINNNKISEEDYNLMSKQNNSSLILSLNAKENETNFFGFIIPYLSECQNVTLTNNFEETILINMNELILPIPLEGDKSLLTFQIESTTFTKELESGVLLLEDQTEVMNNKSYPLQNLTFKPKIPAGKTNIISYFGSTNTNKTSKCFITISTCSVHCAACSYQSGENVCNTCTSGYGMDQNKICSIKCNNNCKSCSSLKCNECIEGYYFRENDSLMCYNGELINYYFETKINKYLRCAQNCKICSNSSMCKICDQGYYLSEGKCLKNFTSLIEAFGDIKNNIEYYAKERSIIQGSNYVIEIRSLNKYQFNKNNNISYLNFTKCGGLLSNYYKIDISELFLLKIDLTNYNSLTNTVKFNIISKNGTTLDPSVCQKMNYTYPVSKNRFKNYETVYNFSKVNIDLLNPDDKYLHSICVLNEKFELDLSIDVRQKEFYANESYCKDTCKYISFNITESVIHCECNVTKIDEINEEQDTPINSIIDTFVAKSVITSECWELFKHTERKLYKNTQFYTVTIVSCPLLGILIPIWSKGHFFIRPKKKKKEEKKDEDKKNIDNNNLNNDDINNNNNINNNGHSINNNINSHEGKSNINSERIVLKDETKMKELDKTMKSGLNNLLKNDITNNDQSSFFNDNTKNASIINENNEITNNNKAILPLPDKENNDASIIINKNSNESTNQQNNINMNIQNDNTSSNNERVDKNEEQSIVLKINFEKMTFNDALKHQQHPITQIYVHYFFLFTPVIQGIIKYINYQIETLEMLIIIHIMLLSFVIDILLNGMSYMEETITEKYYNRIYNSVFYQIIKNVISFFVALFFSTVISFYLNWMFKKCSEYYELILFHLKFLLLIISELGLVLFTIYHHSLIGIIYYHSRKDILIGEILSILFNFGVILISCFIIVLLRAISLCCKSQIIFIIQKLLFMVCNFILG